MRLNGSRPLIGQQFGRWTVVPGDAEPSQYGQPRVVCQCACGTIRPVVERTLMTNASKSCGCLRVEVTGAKTRTHGLSHKNSPEYRCWMALRARCNNPNTIGFKRYGGRGITVCAEWDSFERFLSDMGPRPSAKHTIDRIDNDGPYAPWNCRWASRVEQVRNTRASVSVKYQGRTQSLKEWSDETGIVYETLYNRLFTYGWTTERAMTEPTHPYRR